MENFETFHLQHIEASFKWKDGQYQVQTVIRGPHQARGTAMEDLKSLAH